VRNASSSTASETSAAQRWTNCFREYLYSLLQRGAKDEISIMMTHETPGPFGAAHLTEGDIAHLSDNVILLQFAPRDAQIHRTLIVLETRASRHDPDIREFTISPEGIVLGGPLGHPGAPMSGIGTAEQRRARVGADPTRL
jgi:circadian clock protein KaiC